METLQEKLARLKSAPVTPMQEKLAQLKAAKEQTVPVEEAAPEREYGAMDYAKQAAGGFNRGLWDIVDLPVTLGNLVTGAGTQAWNKITGDNATNKLEAMTPSKAIDNLTGGFVSDATKRTIPEGEDALGDAVYTGLEYGGSAALPFAGTMGAAAKATKAGSTGLQTLRSSADTLRQGLQATKWDALSGVGAAGGEYVGNQLLAEDSSA